jgi:hypothetical protein
MMIELRSRAFLAPRAPRAKRRPDPDLDLDRDRDRDLDRGPDLDLDLAPPAISCY